MTTQPERPPAGTAIRLNQTADLALPALNHHLARFVVLTNSPPRAPRSVDGVEPTRVTWRLVAANNRSIGQAAAMFGSIEECREDIARVSAAITLATVSVHFHLGSFTATGSYWTWLVTVDQRSAASSTHPYKRRIECERALRYFLDAILLGSPLPIANSVRRLGSRLKACPV